MVITVLEATVKADKWDALQKVFKKVADSDSIRPTESYLIQGRESKETWRIISIWKDEAVFKKVRESGETPAGFLIFREAGAEPKLSIFDIKKEI